MREEARQARMAQLRQELARMEWCLADLNVAIQQKEIEEAHALATHRSDDNPSHLLEKPANGSTAAVQISSMSPAATPSLPSNTCTDASLQGSGPLPAHTHALSKR